jgi:hypothetical protein
MFIYKKKTLLCKNQDESRRDHGTKSFMRINLLIYDKSIFTYMTFYTRSLLSFLTYDKNLLHFFICVKKPVRQGLKAEKVHASPGGRELRSI